MLLWDLINSHCVHESESDSQPVFLGLGLIQFGYKIASQQRSLERKRQTNRGSLGLKWINSHQALAFSASRSLVCLLTFL